jgi:hypothetical protein
VPHASHDVESLALHLLSRVATLVAPKDLVKVILTAVGRPVQTCGTKVQLSRVLASSIILGIGKSVFNCCERLRP